MKLNTNNILNIVLNSLATFRNYSSFITRQMYNKINLHYIFTTHKYLNCAKMFIACISKALPDVGIVKDSADGLTEQLCSRMTLNTGVFNGRDVIADMPICSQMRV